MFESSPFVSIPATGNFLSTPQHFPATIATTHRIWCVVLHVYHLKEV